MPETELSSGRNPRVRLEALLRSRLEAPVLAPIRAFRLAYLPLLTIYLASGALGITAVADTFWVKQSLTLTPAELASLAVWLQLPWTAKMVVSEFVDALPILGSQRRSYTLIGAGLIACGARAAGRRRGRLDRLRGARAPLRAGPAAGRDRQRHPGGRGRCHEPRGRARAPIPTAARGRRPRSTADLAMVEVLARLTYSIGAFAVGGIAGVLAKTFAYETVFLMGLIVPALSVSGGLLVQSARRPRPRARLAHLRRRHPARRHGDAARAVRLPLCPGDRVPRLARRHLPDAAAGDGAPGAGGEAAHRGRGHRHLRLPGGADAGRGLPLVRHGPAGLRRDVLRRAGPHGHGRRPHRHVAAHRCRGAPAGDHRAAVADGSRRRAVPAEPAAGARRARVDRSARSASARAASR